MMERLTKRNENGKAMFGREYGEPPYPVVTQEFLDRLAAYEDTGLSPEEVKDMAENAETRLLTFLEAMYGISVGELMGLIEAKKRGRVVVLPCKVGDTLFFVKDGDIYSGVFRYMHWEHHKDRGVRSEIRVNITPYTTMGASFDDFGKTVFLTREEAENALRGGDNA